MGYFYHYNGIKYTSVKAEFNEQVLLKGLAKNDAKAIETIYKNNFTMVQSFVLNNNGTYDDARDIFQEAMIVLYENAKLESFVLTCQIKTYVYSICRRLWLKRLQYLNRFTTPVESLEETVSVEEDIDFQQKRNADFAIMERALGSLGEPCKSLLEAYYLEKKDMTDIAASFGYTNADNAKNQKYKCLMRLKKLFFSQYNIGE
ncbi:MAG: sigma-70 family polymerase sigma factor [Segetibacter sp.]|nr:sigma-70 family polymerase sigma factor [Segetibacter sp.]